MKRLDWFLELAVLLMIGLVIYAIPHDGPPLALAMHQIGWTQERIAGRHKTTDDAALEGAK